MNAPSRRDRLRPVELLVLSAVMAAFVGLVVLMSTRELSLAGIFAGVAFIVTLVVIAMFALTFKPNETERHEIDDDDSQRPTGH
ncbi:hypothetical protein GCM10010988_24180 [Cnuibacter physcomitrellae]|uniref:Uncharacterized protein n=1 Tax=Cnuibacter physcomitrellae TaxID=1619308 RepID=A0A1X9LPG0_9MICO|nr:hypothetical protein [Cnuibacter physcomitrellae]ARJ07063.1 hypothetical protein B5808_18895 [Cnuibacter physcomitrellae]GGI39460.1 hypothetical protein GCM10010988_24180 [Cnuibacter physcomitrellae]